MSLHPGYIPPTRGAFRTIKLPDGGGGYDWREVWVLNAPRRCATCADLGELDDETRCPSCGGDTPRYCRTRDGKDWVPERPENSS